MKRIFGKKWKMLYLAGLAAVFFLGLKHLGDTRAGAYGSGDYWLTGWYLLLFFSCIAGLAILGIIIVRKKKGVAIHLETVYLVSGLFFGFLYLLVLPPLSAPDEVSHYLTSYQLSSKLMGKESNNGEGRVIVRTEDWFLEDSKDEYVWVPAEDGTLYRENKSAESEVLGRTLTEETYSMIHKKGLFDWEEAKEGNTNGKAISYFPPVVTTPLAYAPQALGVMLARLMGLNSLGLAYLGRLFNLIFFVAATYFSMRKLPFGKEVLFGVAMLPMTLHLSASFSYDVMIMGGLFYFTAYCLDLAYRKDHVSWKDVGVLAALLAVVGPCKMVYAVVMGLCLLIPVKKFGGWKPWLLSAAVVLAAFAAAMLLVNTRTIVTYATEQDSYIMWAEEAGYSLTQLIHNPGLLFKMFYNTVIWQAEYYHLTMIGAYLGNLDVVLDVPYLLVVGFSGCLLLLAFKKPSEVIRFSKGQKAWVVFIFSGCIGLTMLSMLIAWTPVSSHVITGVQGRYFLPMLPVVLMVCKNHYIVLAKNYDRAVLFLMFCANSYVLLRLFSIVSMRL